MAYGLSEITQNGVDYRINDPNIANEFSASTAYSSGTYVNYNGILYQFTTDHPAGAWNASHVSVVEVGDEIADLKSAIKGTANSIFTYEQMLIDVTASGWRLNETNGLCSSNSSYKMVKYKVDAGHIVKIISDDRFQFQTIATVPSGGDSNKVGVTYGAGEYILVVPETATYLIVSTPISDSKATVYIGRDNIINGLYTVLGDNLISITANNKTHNGITFTTTSNTVVANGSTSSDNRAYIDICTFVPMETGRYFLSGAPKGGSSSTYFLYCQNTNAYDYGSGAVYSLTKDVPYTFRIIIGTNYTANNLTFIPSIIYMDSVKFSSNELKNKIDFFIESGKMNILNQEYILDAEGWAYEDKIYSGRLETLNRQFGVNSSGYPIEFESNKQYTILCEAYHDGESISGSNGLIVRLKYSDGTFSNVINFSNTAISPETKIAVSASNKSISNLLLTYGNDTGASWHIVRLAIYKGTGILGDLDYDIIVDKKARYEISNIYDKFIFGNYNLFNPIYLETMGGWKKISENEYFGTAQKLTNTFNTISYPVDFKPGKQYSITMEAYHEGERVVGSYGLNFSFMYSDGTVETRTIGFENTRVDWTRKIGLSNPEKDVVGIVTKNGSNSNFVWHVRNVMIIEGSDPNQYHPYVTVEREPEPYIDVSVINPGGKGGSVGAGILFRFPEGKRMLMDTHVDGYGVWNNGDGGFTRDVRQRTMTSNIRFDYLLLSHYHADHVGGLLDWIDNGWLTNGKIDIYGATVFLPPEITTNNLQNIAGDDANTLIQRQTKIVNALQAQNCTILRPTEGQQVSIGDVNITFVNCDHSIYYPGGDYESTNYNDFSLCAYVEYGTETFFYTADLGPIGEQYLSTLSNSLLKSTFMTAPHHGWQASGSGVSGANKLYPDFINRVSPDVVISPNGETHRPDSGTAASMLNSESAVQTWCERTGVPNYATCLNGTIDFKMYKHGWKFNSSYIRYIRNDKNWKYSDNTEYIES